VSGSCDGALLLLVVVVDCWQSKLHVCGHKLNVADDEQSMLEFLQITGSSIEQLYTEQLTPEKPLLHTRVVVAIVVVVVVVASVPFGVRREKS